MHSPRLDNAIKSLQDDEYAAKMTRAMQWRRVKKESPEIADFLIEMNLFFGKPKWIEVIIDGQIILNTKK